MGVTIVNGKKHRRMASEIQHDVGDQETIAINFNHRPFRFTTTSTSSGRGLRIDSVEEGSFGWRCGLRRNMEMFQCDNTDLASLTHEEAQRILDSTLLEGNLDENGDAAYTPVTFWFRRPQEHLSPVHSIRVTFSNPPSKEHTQSLNGSAESEEPNSAASAMSGAPGDPLEEEGSDVSDLGDDDLAAFDTAFDVGFDQAQREATRPPDESERRLEFKFKRDSKDADILFETLSTMLQSASDEKRELFAAFLDSKSKDITIAVDWDDSGPG